jgi:hypothetical protein
MKNIILTSSFIFLTLSLVAQVNFDLGIKGGVNFSKISFDADDYSSESVTKSHFGAFGRIGWNRIFIQPELYFSGKGGDITSDVFSTAASFDYKTFDIPVLLGFKLIKHKAFDLQLLAGPVFSHITSEDLSSDEVFDQSFYEDKYVGIQYGLGVDILFVTIHARMENGLSDFYSQSGNSAKNQTFMVSVGFKFL